ncbi:hypothetical protein N7517_007671 [Penicillium concentricum]|uniref:Secreted protein CSS2 C-terminal domain-containing protein n=1 Tax=Penicillium concentricum TaxID=293559 RepID=A0A9W9SC54_9EURO|nr:uncharacterized protein N7517_007671 [Penicillium concentricum]KAJ5375665.1 hypothetical protein N7517_007671 [Penicillium concentricum]
MRFPTVSILTLNIFYGLTSAQPSTPPSSTLGQPIEGQLLPDGWYAIHFDGSEELISAALEAAFPDVNTTKTLVVREPIKVCESGLSKMAQCATIAQFAYTISAGIAGVVWGQSKKKSCSKVKGTLDGWKYEYYATGRNCDTTAQQDTIHGALYHFLASVEKNKICGTQCLSMDHGGTWEGYLKFGKEEWYDANAYCGPRLSFSPCASGGNNSFK